MISSLRRNLQQEHVQRLIDLILEKNQRAAAYKPISDLARMQLGTLSKKIAARVKKCGDKMDDYSRAHLLEAQMRINQALKAGYTYNSAATRGSTSIMILGETPAE